MTWDAPRVAALEASLLAAGMTVATCESLTGGLVISALVEPAGASAVVRGSIVAYATDVKSSLVGVDLALLASQGAVNAEVATQMARGARELLGASIGVATTGVAGPDVQDGAPVGTVFVAVSTPQGERCEGAHFVGDRDEIRRAACDLALELIANSVPRE